MNRYGSQLSAISRQLRTENAGFSGSQSLAESAPARADRVPADDSIPGRGRYGLTSQLRRGASSIPANIAEGCGRGSDPDFRRFLFQAMGSACELEYHLLLTRDLTLLEEVEYEQLNRTVSEVKRMLSSLIKRLGAES